MERVATGAADAATITASTTPSAPPPTPPPWPPWPPLASSPAAFNAFAREVGARGLRFADVLGLDEDLLQLLPQPVVALIAAYPTTKAAAAHLDRLEELHRGQERGATMAGNVNDSGDGEGSALKGQKHNVELEPRAEEGEANIRVTDSGASNDSARGCDDDMPPLFLRQLAGGTCGTIAVLHAVGNTDSFSASGEPPQHGSKTASGGHDSLLWSDLDGDGASGKKEEGGANDDLVASRSRRLVESAALRAAHDRCAVATATGAAPAGVRQGRHYVTWVRAGSSLWMLDGRRRRPVRCAGTTSPRSFLRDAAAQVRALVAAVTAEDSDAVLSVLAAVSDGA